LSMQIPELNGKRGMEVTPEPNLVGPGSLNPALKGFRGVVGITYQQALLLLGALSVVSVLLLLFCSQLQLYLAGLGSLLHSVKILYKDLVPLSWRLQVYTIRAHLLQTFANPYYYLGIAAVFTLQWLFPAKKEQRVFSVGLAQDLIYFIFISMVLVYFAPPYVGFLDRLYARHLSFLTIQTVAAWPLAIRAVSGLVFNDLLHWTHHFLRHKIRALWYFHMIHHSQREMNVFADVRGHFVETFIALSVVFIPLNMFGVSFANKGWLYFVPVLYFRLYHANIRTNLGPLKHVFVTPQSHRIHHSAEPRHWDKNYGFIFTIWDQIFGTQYKNYDEYPDTGIDEQDFPLESTYTGVVKTFCAQYVYPFRRLLQWK
jgi:sterol desaturase/sphingolipid hydroxylase (fatty acid hydroxylase superfamily)